MDSNNMYQNNQGAGGDPENAQSANYNDNGYYAYDNAQNPYSQNSGQNPYEQYAGQNPYEQSAVQNPYNQDVNQNAYQNPYGQDVNQNAYQNPYGQDVNQNAYQNPYNQDVNQNPNYQPYQYGNYQTSYQQTSQLDLEEPVKMSEWIIAFLVLMVPCVNIVMVFIWAFSKTEKKSKSNFFKAYLAFCGVVLGLYLIVMIIVVAAGVALAG